MITLDEYLKNPCGTLSIPYWKNKQIAIPETMKIVHDSEYIAGDYEGYTEEPYFRLRHTLENVGTMSDEDYYVKTATQEDIPVIVEIINCSYSDLSVTEEQMTDYTKSKVYDENFWIIAYDKESDVAVGCGIAEFDEEAKEGILEWIQVLPEYRGKKIGQLIVNELLRRLADKASFVTVSGKQNNLTKPERLYRKCGFVGNDIWHVMVRK